MAKHYHISPLDLSELPYYRFQIMLKNIKEMVKEEEARREKMEREQAAKSKAEQARAKSKTKH